jgi:hypothetical protein
MYRMCLCGDIVNDHTRGDGQKSVDYNLRLYSAGNFV